MNKVLVVAPHPDDETLGCGGTILKHKESGDEVHWLIVTGISEETGWKVERVKSEDEEIARASLFYNFNSTHHLRLPTTKLDELAFGDVITRVSKIIRKLEPKIIYVPYRGDIHTDHKVVFDAVTSCTKSFRNSFIKRILAYETLSETDFGINPDYLGFRPNVFVNISNYLQRKLDAALIYQNEMGIFPFPRSQQAMKALAELRGVATGCSAAEAFMLLKEIID